MFKNLKTKLIISIIALMLTLSGVNLIIGVSTSYLALIDNVENQLQATITTAQSGITHTLSLYRNEAAAVAKTIEVTNGGFQAAAEEAAASAENFGWKGVGFADASGLVYSEDTGMNGLNLSEESFFQQALSGNTIISTTYIDKNNEIRVFICSPSTGEKGVFLVGLDGMILRNMIKDITIGKTGNVFLLDKTGTMIANIREEMVLERRNYIEIAKTDQAAVSMGKVYTKMAAGETGVSRYDFNGVPRIAAYMAVPQSDGWSVGAVAPTEEMTSSIWISILWMLGSSIILLLLAAAVSVKLSNGIANPIQAVTERIKKLSYGDLHSDVPPVKGRDETKQLAEATQKIISDLGSIIQDITNSLNELAKGNFTVDSQAKELYTGDFEAIATSMYTIIGRLSDTIRQIHQVSNEVASGSEQISDGAQALSQGAAEQASSIEELSATIADIENQVQHNAARAQKAKDTVENVGGQVMKSNQQMQEMTQAMDAISNSSSEIKKIIKAIEDIAFQTNILALNAAVEAARAGAAGKGFAVVAGEVRNLASRSSEASKNTSGLIENSLQAVERGSILADETAASLLAVVEGTKHITEQIDQIAHASSGQASSISKITKGIGQIANVIQTNSATAEESAASSEELSGQSQILKNLVDQFRLK